VLRHNVSQWASEKLFCEPITAGGDQTDRQMARSYLKPRYAEARTPLQFKWMRFAAKRPVSSSHSQTKTRRGCITQVWLVERRAAGRLMRACLLGSVVSVLIVINSIN
jgi:hypothetical protein